MKRNSIMGILILLGVMFILPIKVHAAGLISGINVEGVGDLNVSKKTWNLSFTTSLDYVNVKATAADSSTEVKGDGKITIKEGKNEIVITATNGSTTENYTINLNVTKTSGKSSSSYDKDAQDESIVKNPETGAFLNVSFVVLSIISILFIANAVSKKNKFYKL